MKQEILVFRHVAFEGLGRIGAAIERRGLGWRYVDREEAPETGDAAGLIFMGGPMSANDPLPYLEREMAIVRAAVERGQAVLGVCLGAQLIAKALGARVYRNARKEIGWFDLGFTEAARRDALFAGVNGTETVFHWHGETFDLPEGATHLAYSEACVNQAFRAGTNVYGMQFHLEVTPEMITEWCGAEENCGDVRGLEAPIDAEYNAARLGQLSQEVFGRWCECLADGVGFGGSLGNDRAGK